MLISAILVCHITLSMIVLATFIVRYIKAFIDKDYPKTGKKLLITSSGLLVISGITLSVMGHLSITTICIESLALIAGLVIIEFALAKLSKKLATTKI